MGAYQHTIIEDHDPSSEDTTSGIVDEITSRTGEGTGALVFIEVHRTHETPGYTSSPTNTLSLANSVAHELTHLLSCEHGDGEIMGIDMDGIPVSSKLSSTMIAKIRSLQHP